MDKPHTPYPDCWCKPVEDSEEPGIFIHNQDTEEETMAVTHATETYDAAPKETAPSVIINMDSVVDHIPYDRTEELPVGFIEFLGGHLATGPVRLWTANEHAVPEIWNWLLDQFAYETKEVTIVGAVTMETSPEKPEGAVDFVPPPPAAPVNVDVPYISPEDAGVSDTLGATMGNWKGAPTSYTYAWSGVGASNGNQYTVVEDDAGSTITCVVTAVNDVGSTAAPPSNGVLIPGTPPVVQSAHSSRTKK